MPDADAQDYYWTLKQRVNRRNALVKTKSMLMRQFHEQIQYSYLSYKKFFHIITEMMLSLQNVQKQLVNISSEGEISLKVLDENANMIK